MRNPSGAPERSRPAAPEKFREFVDWQIRRVAAVVKKATKARALSAELGLILNASFAPPMKRQPWAAQRLEAAVRRGVIKRWIGRLRLAEGLLWLAGIEAGAIVAAKRWLLDALGINH